MSLDTHDESYFASFTDMLVGIIFVFIILLMIVANNYQEATVAVVQTNQELQEARQKVLEDVQDKGRDAQYKQEIAELKAAVDAKSAQTVQAEQQAAQAQQQIRNLKSALDDEKAHQSIKAPEVPNAILPPKPNDDVIIGQMRMLKQNMFNDSRAKLLEVVQDTLKRQGFNVTADIGHGTLVIPDNLLFDAGKSSITNPGKEGISVLARALNQYLPCISPTSDARKLNSCTSLGFQPNDGLDAIFIDDYPATGNTREDKLLLEVPRIISIFNLLKSDQPYLDNGLKNIFGAPVLNYKVNQERRKAQNQDQNSPVNNSVVLRFIMRQPNDQDIVQLRKSAAMNQLPLPH